MPRTLAMAPPLGPHAPFAQIVSAESWLAGFFFLQSPRDQPVQSTGTLGLSAISEVTSAQDFAATAPDRAPEPPAGCSRCRPSAVRLLCVAPAVVVSD